MTFFNKKLPLKRKELFSGLDIGSSKICCAIASVDGENSPLERTAETLPLRIIGVGYQISKGIKAGKIVSLEALENSILSAVQNAEQAAGQNINNVYVSLPASLTQSSIIKSQILIAGGQVEENHLRKLLEINQEDFIKNNRHIIHILPLTYTLDSAIGIRDPKGMIGKNLSVTLHVITAPTNLIRNLDHCIGRCHLDVAGYVSSAYASGLSTLVEDELELGTTVIDMGGAQTTIASFMNGSLVNLSFIPIGGNNITNDIARGLGTPLSQAERLKTLYGNLLSSGTDDQESIFIHPMGEINSNHNHYISKGALTRIIKSRAEEILELMMMRIKGSQTETLAHHRFILTGGASQLQGLREFSSQFFSRQIRLGSPLGLQGTFDIIGSPSFSTCAGLLYYALQDYNGHRLNLPSLKKWDFLRRINLWFRENF